MYFYYNGGQFGIEPMHLKNLDATRKFAKDLAQKIQPGDWILLHGPLGAGKTHLAKALIHALGAADETMVDSPTFAIMNHFQGGPVEVLHMDLYRLGAGDLDCIQPDYLLRSPAIKIVEWPDILGDWLEQMNGYFIQLDYIEGEGRYAQIFPLGEP